MVNAELIRLKMALRVSKVGVKNVALLTMGVCKVLFAHFLGMLRAFLDFASDILFGIVNRRPTDALPKITNLLLLEPATSLAAKIRSRKVTSSEVVESFISRIEEVNPILNCVVDRNYAEARKLAQEADQLIASGTKDERQMETDTPFLGVPFTTKDCFQVRGLRQTAGLLKRKDLVATEDAETVKQMRNAGAILLAVTNVSELCMWWESDNNVYGRTNNPYNTARIVGGSSGGEACTIAAAASPFGIGSDIGGSIRMPCFFNGIFGHKPTTGIVSNHGQAPIALNELQEFLCTGPMCRHATDLIPIYRVLAGSNINKLKLDQQVDIKSLKFYYMESDGGCKVVSKVHPDVRKAIGQVVYYLEKTHGIQARKVDIKKMKHSLPIWSNKMGGADSPSFSEHMTDNQGKVSGGWELFKWIFRLSDHTLPAIALSLFEKLNGPNSEHYPRFVEMCRDLQQEFEAMLKEDGVFLYPTHPRPAPYHHQPIAMPFNFAYTAIFNVLGFPVTQCPLGLSGDGLPVGIQIVTNRYNDHLSLAVARELEQMFGGWVSPSVIQ